MWAIRSGCSGQMSNCERIAQVAHDKWANVSHSLRSLRTNEWMSKSLVFFAQIAHFLFRSPKRSDSLKNRILCTFLHFFLIFKKSKRFALLIPSEQGEWIAQVAQDKWVTVSKSLRSLRRNKRLFANRSGCLTKISKWANCSLFERMAHSLTFLAKVDSQPWYSTQVWLAWRQAEPCSDYRSLAQTSTKSGFTKTLSQSPWPS